MLGSLTRGAVVALVLASPALAAPVAVEVTSDVLNVRDDVLGEVLGALDQGDRVVAHAGRDGWLEIDWEGQTAWISGAYVRRVAATGARVTEDVLDLRAAPDAGSALVGVVARDQVYVVVDARGGWTRLQVGARSAWAASWALEEVDLGAGGAPSAPSAPATSVTAEELEVLARICKGEALQCSFEGQVAVCAVVLNRVRAPGFPGTIAGVAHQPWQFSCYNADVRDRLYWGPIPQECWDAARAAVAGQDPTGGATFYFNPFLVRPSWADDMVFLVRIGSDALDCHDFYRPRR